MYFFAKNKLFDSHKATYKFGIQELPLELVNHIFTFLPLLDLHALQKISWYFSIQIKAGSTWKKKVQAHFNLTPPIEYALTPLSVYTEWLIKQHNEDSFKSMCEYIFNPVDNPNSYVTHNYAVSLSRDILRKKSLEEIKKATTSYHLEVINSCSEIMQENLFNARLKTCLIEIAILTSQTDVVYHLVTAMDLLDIKALTKLLLLAVEKKQLQTAAALSELLLNVFASRIKETNVSRQAVADYAISHFFTFTSLSQTECAGVLSILCCETYPNSRPSLESIEKVLVWLSKINDISVRDRVNFWQKIVLVNEPFENLNRQCASTMLKFAAEEGNLFLVNFFYSLSGKNRVAISSIDAALTIATHKKRWPIAEYLCSNPKKSNRPTIQCVNQLLLENEPPLMDGGILIKYLCTQGASPDTETINKAIKSAAQLGRLDSVKYFKNWLISKQRELVVFDELDKQSVTYALPENIKNWIHNGKRAVNCKPNLKTDISPLANVVLVLEGYTRVNFWNRLREGAWHRNHIKPVKIIIDAIKAGQITTREQLFQQLSEIMSLNNFNKKGELAKYIQVIEEQIEWEQPPKPKVFSPTLSS